MAKYDEYTDAEIIAALLDVHNWARVSGTLVNGFTRTLSPDGDYGWQGVTQEQIETAITA